MSRAFMKESEPTEPRCPGCDGLGEQVGVRTLESHLPPEARAVVGEKVYYCAGSDCRIAYFNAWGAGVPRDQMKGGAWPKDPEAPICPCFGMTAADVIADAQAGRKDRVRDLTERSRGPEARCTERCPDGVPCIPRVLRLFRENI